MKIMELSVPELIHLRELQEIALESRKAAELIQNRFSTSFGLANTKIHVYHTTHFGEYEGDAQAKLFKKVAWGSGLAGVIIGGILIYFFGQYM